jgi:hypothetical protein
LNIPLSFVVGGTGEDNGRKGKGRRETTMKKVIAILLTVGLFAALPGSASAGGRGGHGGHYGHGGHGAGGFFVGLLGGAILGSVLSHAYEPVYAYPPRVYYAPPERVWVPGRYETRYVRQWVPGHWEVVRHEGRGEDDGYSRGRRVWVPGYYEEVPARVWLPGYWEERG